MLSWLLNAVYAALVVAVSPLLLYRSFKLGKYRAGWGQKLWGNVPSRESARPCVWLHAVSVGEVLQIQPVLEALRQRCPDTEFVISTTTSTGYDVAKKRYPRDQVIYFPLDFSWAVSRALSRINPAAIVLVELELWPNFIAAAHRRHVPILLINGRISERSYRGYRRIRPLMQGLLSQLSVLAVQNETYATRLRELGAPAGKVHVTGSIKFDRVLADRHNPQTAALRAGFGIGPHAPVFIAGSTQAPEEEFAVETWLALRAKHPGLRLILVPRHQERFEEVATLIREKFRLPLVRRSRLAAGESASQQAGNDVGQCVCLLDTLGELSACWGLATIAFVGGSLTNRGGQNMLEPAGYGAAVLFGPNTRNFKDIVEQLLLADAAIVVKDAAELTATVDRLLSNPESLAELGSRAQRLVLAQKGATQRTVELILPWLKGISAASQQIANSRAA